MTNQTRKLDQEHIDFLNSLDGQYTSDTAAGMLRDQFGIDITGSAVRYQWKISRGEQPNNINSGDAVVTKGDTQVVSSTTETLKSVDEVLDGMKINRDEWDIEKSSVSKMDRVTKNGVVEVFKVTVNLKKKPAVFDFQSIKQDILEEIDELSKSHGKRELIEYKKEGGLTAVVNIFDAHIEKACFVGDYDAIEEYKKALASFVYNMYDEGITSVVFPIGNDFFNSDNHLGTTNKGTPQDNNMSWRDAFREGRKLISRAIEHLKEIAPVTVLVIPGNHDYTKAFYLGDSIASLYAGDPNVTVDNGDSPRKYYNLSEFGGVLGFVHGDEEKRSDLADIIKDKFPGASFYDRYTGHFHRTLSEDVNGVMFYQEGSMSPPDEWHHKKGFVLSRRVSSCRVYDPKLGLIASYFYNVR